jgi:ribosomal protein S12 methylthiotransferase accessory factor YcaO
VSAADAVAAYRELLARSGAELVEFGIAELDRTGVPVHTVAAFLPGGRLRNGVGYGVDETAARASALGECVEVLQGTTHLPPTVAPDATCVEAASLIPDAGADLDAPRLWVRARRLPRGDDVLIPLEWAAHTSADLPAGYRPLATPITNGLGAGLTYGQALDHCLRELVQRDGNAVSYRALDRGIGVETVLPSPAPGLHPILKVAECDLGMTNVYVVGDDVEPAHPLDVTACGEAAGPDRDQAIGKALREFSASHVRKVFNHGPLEPVLALAPQRYREHVTRLDTADEEPRALQAMLAWLEKSPGELRELVARTTAVTTTVALDALPHTPDRSAYELLTERGFDVLVVDLSPPGGEVVVLKVVVPGLEVETMSYGRCGTRNLDRLLERDLGLVGADASDRPASARALRLPAADPRRGAWLDPVAVRRVVGELYPLYREPARHVAALARARAPGAGAGPAGRVSPPASRAGRRSWSS